LNLIYASRYDADRNHSPSLRNGHAAHWAVIHGIAVCLPKSLMEQFSVTEDFHDIVILTPDNISNETLENIATHFKPDRTYTIAHQGKSFRTALWDYKELIASNQNLSEISPKLTAESCHYVLGDIISGLCSKILLLCPTKK
jgi:hypothetical protein